MASESDSTTAVPLVFHANRAAIGLRRGANWLQLARFCVVGASGYVVNLSVFSLLFVVGGWHYVPAAVVSFTVAVTNNYTWNRLWTFRLERGHVAYQGLRFVVVSLAALGANVTILALLIALGAPEIPAQALAIILVTPLNFLGNKLWSFRIS